MNRFHFLVFGFQYGFSTIMTKALLPDFTFFLEFHFFVHLAIQMFSFVRTCDCWYKSLIIDVIWTKNNNSSKKMILSWNPVPWNLKKTKCIRKHLYQYFYLANLKGNIHVQSLVGEQIACWIILPFLWLPKYY